MEYSEENIEESAGAGTSPSQELGMPIGQPGKPERRKERRRYKFSWSTEKESIVGPWKWQLVWAYDLDDALENLKKMLQDKLGHWEDVRLRPWAIEEWAGGNSRVDLRIAGSGGFELAPTNEEEPELHLEEAPKESHWERAKREGGMVIVGDAASVEVKEAAREKELRGRWGSFKDAAVAALDRLIPPPKSPKGMRR